MKANTKNLNLYLYSFILIITDVLVLFLSFKLSIFLRQNLFIEQLPTFEVTHIKDYYWIIYVTMFMFLAEKLYFIRHDFWGDMKRVLKALIFSFLAVFTVITLAKISEHYSRSFIFIFFIIATFLIPISKRLLKKLIFSFDLFKLRVKIEADKKQFEILQNEMIDNWYLGYKLVKNNFDMVMISSKNFTVDELQSIIRKYQKQTQDIYIIPYMDHLDFSHTSIVDYSNIRISALHLENRLLNSKNTFIKYMFEKTLVIIIFPFAFLLHIIISIIIKLDSDGTAIFKQKRLGKNSKPFSCYKYRTMYTDSQEILNEYLKNNPNEVKNYKIYHKYTNDPRVTRVGKFLRKTSMDEFPQFYNILRGDMNLMGPRPYMLNEQNKIGKFNQSIILKVKPGLTGLWQVNGRNELTFQQRIELDLWYIQNWSLWMDFVIFLKTIKVVISKVGAK